jgi:hypothetical protein
MLAIMWLPANVVVLACTAMTVACAKGYYVRVAEGLTSPSLTETMQVAPRMFAASDLTAACQSPRRIARLEAPTRSLELRVGDRLALNTLRVVAVGEAGSAVTDVPVVIEVEELTPPVVQLRSDDPDLNAGRLLSVGSGTVRVRVRTLCTSRPAELNIIARVAP